MKSTATGSRPREGGGVTIEEGARTGERAARADLQRGADPSGSMVLRQDADADLPGQRVAREGEDAGRVVMRPGHGIHLTLSDEISTSTTKCQSAGGRRPRIGELCLPRRPQSTGLNNLTAL